MSGYPRQIHLQHQSELIRLFDSVAERATQFIVSRFPRTLGVIVDGSVGRGEPSRYSDVDVLVVMPSGRTPEWFSYFEDRAYVSVGFVSVKKFRETPHNHKEFYWIRGGAHSARILYDRRSILKRIIKQRRNARTTPRIWELSLWDAYHNIIEYSGKLRNGWDHVDEYLTRYAARIIAQYSEQAVIALNDLSPISENKVWHQSMKAKKTPPHFQIDYPLSLGIKGTRRTSLVFSSALRLAKETLDLIKEETKEVARHQHFKDLVNEPLKKHGL